MIMLSALMAASLGFITGLIGRARTRWVAFAALFLGPFVALAAWMIWLLPHVPDLNSVVASYAMTVGFALMLGMPYIVTWLMLSTIGFWLARTRVLRHTCERASCDFD